MRTVDVWRAAVLVVWVVAAGCAPKSQEAALPSPSSTPAPAAVAVTITDRDWELVAVGERTNPRGSENRPATLRLDSSTSRAAGFSGCNRYNATYALRGDSLTFAAPISTKMACTEGMELEGAFLGALTAARTYEATDTTLVLQAQGAPLMRFHSP